MLFMSSWGYASLSSNIYQSFKNTNNKIEKGKQDGGDANKQRPNYHLRANKQLKKNGKKQR